MTRGKFIAVEGTEGVGKSTNIEFIKKQIELAGKELIITREPGGTPLAEELRDILLQERNERFDPIAELLIIFAARAQHLEEVIKPALAEGKWVLSDRFTDATFAYQGAGRGLPLEIIGELESMVQRGTHPDKVIYLDIDVEIGLARAKSRADLDRFEREEVEFFHRVRHGYHSRIAAYPARYFVIDAGRELEQVQADIARALDKLLKD